jgi:hypothetical protein
VEVVVGVAVAVEGVLVVVATVSTVVALSVAVAMLPPSVATVVSPVAAGVVAESPVWAGVCVDWVVAVCSGVCVSVAVGDAVVPAPVLFSRSALRDDTMPAQTFCSCVLRSAVVAMPASFRHMKQDEICVLAERWG